MVNWRTVVTYEVITGEEAFNGNAETLGEMVSNGDAAASLIDRQDPEEISDEVAERLRTLHGLENP